MVWYSHLLNFPQFVVIHTVRGFGIVNKAEIYVFLEFSCFLKGFGVVNKAEIDDFLKLSCFFYDPTDVGKFISGSSASFKSSLNIWKYLVTYC